MERLDSVFSQRLKARVEKITEKPSEWIERYFYVPDPRDPVTGEFLPPGPIRLSEHQKRIINEALSKDEHGKFKYSTVIYSAPKKSGKSAIASAVTLYVAFSRPYSFVYCLANDGKQSADRIYEPIHRCMRLHKTLNGPFYKENPNKTDITLSNNTRIEAIPCDAAGEAGSQPLLSVWSGLWAVNSDAKRRLWTELSIPPTLHGYAMRWVESYAGEKGKAELLEQLYNVAVKKGTPHPDFEDLKSRGEPVVWVNESARLFCYWDHEPRMPWQTDDYYAEEVAYHTPSEFARIHRNEWVTPTDVFVQAEWWHSLSKNLGPISPYTPVVIGLDGAISNDYAALVGVTRDPDNNEHTAVRFCYIFTPKRSGGTIKISETVEPLLRLLCKKYNVVCVAYDKYQLEDMAQRLRKESLVWMYNFSQQTERSVADKSLYDSIINRTIWWDINGEGLPFNGEVPSLYQHITQAGAKTDGGKFRLDKLSDDAKIDAAVATSMAREMCKRLMITNKDKRTESIVRQHTRGKMTDDEFMRAVAEIR